MDPDLVPVLERSHTVSRRDLFQIPASPSVPDRTDDRAGSGTNGEARQGRRDELTIEDCVRDLTDVVRFVGQKPNALSCGKVVENL